MLDQAVEHFLFLGGQSAEMVEAYLDARNDFAVVRKFNLSSRIRSVGLFRDSASCQIAGDFSMFSSTRIFSIFGRGELTSGPSLSNI